MAKGNMLLGYSRGSVGDVTFTKIKGQQVAKARNRNPHNPRTNKQSLQRAMFAAAVKFYTRGNQAFYKFAFENKRQVESDYNAFMRENVKRAPAISREAFANYDYPVFAPFLMSKGTLQPLEGRWASSTVDVMLGIPTPAADPLTVGELSTLLLANPRYKEGDILTFVAIMSPYNGQYPSATAEGSGKPRWEIQQFIIDPTSTRSAEQFGIWKYVTIDDGVSYEIDTEAIEQGTQLWAGVGIHTRNTDAGLKASSQELILNPTAETAYEAAMADAYKQAVIASWQANGSVDAAPEAILQGSIAYED